MEIKKGVGGWLLFLCVVLTILFPLATANNLLESYKMVSMLRDQYPGLWNIMLIDTAMCGLLIAFSIYAGIGLWAVRPNAVQTAKKYMFAYLGYALISAVLPFFAGLPEESNQAVMQEVGRQTARSLVFFSIWYAYLCKSQRVKATYSLDIKEMSQDLLKKTDQF